MTAIPLLRPGLPVDTIAWRGLQPITRHQFQCDLASLLAILPDRAYVLNHCEDRYQFLVGLAATLVKRQISLFPSNRAPDVLAELARDYPQVYCLTDQADAKEVAAMPVVRYDTETDRGVAADPVFPVHQQVALAFTSGSTGVPKRFPKYWGGFVRESQVAGQRLGLDVASGGQVLATVPAQHMYGFVYSVIMPAQWGYVIGAERPFYPEDIRRALAARPVPAVLVTTPVHIRACVLDTVPLPPMDFILSSTAPLDAALAAEAETRYGTHVQEFYGSTETGAIASRRQAESDVWKTFDEITVSEADGGFRVEASYLPEAQVLGDAVEIRSPREFVLHGRNTEIVKIAGKRIALGDLNRLLLAIDGVRDGAFFLPDVGTGLETRLAALVVAPGRNRAQILEALRECIDPVFLPRPLRLVEALPRNATGKLPRATLLAFYRQLEEKPAAE
jgi:acyl-coenzyme A synthetase/AMP-(fatty) acid ligase